MIVLHQSHPLLFGVAGAQASRRAIWLSLVGILVALMGYLFGDDADFPFFAFMTVLIGLHGLLAVMVSAGNLLFLFRYFLIWLLIFGTAMVWAWYGGEVNVAPFGLQYQTASTTRVLVLAGFFSLCGSMLGWNLAMLQHAKRKTEVFVLSARNRSRMAAAGAVLAIGFGLLYLYKAGGVVGGDVAYGTNVQDIGFEFGVFNIFHYIGIALLLLAGIGQTRLRPLYLWMAMATLILGVLSGSRADFLPQIFILLMLLFNRQISQMLTRRRYMALAGWLAGGMLLLITGYAVAFFISLWRTGINLELVLGRMFSSEQGGLLINELFGHRMLYLETGNMMLGGMYAAIVNAAQNGFLLGESYFNYLLMSPPAFFGLPRPMGLEWAVEIDGQQMAQGGIFEVAEAYWNFGLIGCLVVSFLISYVFGWLLKIGLSANNYFFLTWYMVFGFMSFRAVWYQNFSYFRIMTVMLVIYLVASVLFRWLVTGRRRVRQSVMAPGITSGDLESR